MDNFRRTWLEGVRNNIGVIEAMELTALGLGLWILFVLMSVNDPEVDFAIMLGGILIIEGGLLGSWLLYNLYIRIARAGGQSVDMGIWVVAAALTASYTFWAWTILDVNRWIMSKLFYRGDAPLEYAWSLRSKQVRKLWEQGVRDEF